jgi:Domain of unknown function (DUF4260)
VESLPAAIAGKIGGLTRERDWIPANKEPGFMFSKPGVLLRIEGATVFALSLFLYHTTAAPWWHFFLLFLWPDLFMLGYFRSLRVGTQLYNLVHNYVFPAALAAAALHEHRSGLLSFALIWAAHIGADRALGYGLKYPTFFADTHLQRLDEVHPLAGSPA